MGNAAAASKHLAVDTNHCDPCYIIEKKAVGSSYMCRECRHQLCHDCFIHHQKVVSTRNHTVLPLQHREATQFQVTSQTSGSVGTRPALQVSDRQSESADTDVASQVSGRILGSADTLSALQVSGRKAGYDSRSPVSQVSGRILGSADTVSALQVSGRQAGTFDTDAALQASGQILGSADNVSALQFSGRKPQFTETGSALQVSGRKASYDSQTPVSQVSGRIEGPADTTSVAQRKGTKSEKKEQINTQDSETTELEVDGRRVQDEDQATGSDSVDQDQTVTSSVKNMRLDAGTSNTQTTRQTGKPYTLATLEHIFNVKRENDEYCCWITGLVVLQDKLIVCDRSNSKLKVYDSSYRFIYGYKCDDKPYDIDMLDVNTVVVSSCLGRNMRLLSVGNDKMKEIKKINTEYWCEGVCCYEGKIYCVVGDNEVRVYTIDDRLEHTFEHLSDSKVECNHLHYITVNSQTGVLYVTDWYKGVLVLSTSGDVIAVMSHPQLKWPKGITVDDNGDIYVCGHESNNLIQNSGNEQNVVEILSGEDKCKLPKCVKIYGNKMFVSHRDSESNNDKVSIYQLL